MRKNNIQSLTIINATNFETIWEKIIDMYFSQQLQVLNLGGRDVVPSVVLEIDSINLGNLSIHEGSYTMSKMRYLWNSYIVELDLLILKNKITDVLKEELFSFNYLFQVNNHTDKDGCLVSMVVSKIKDLILINVFVRVSESTKIILGDFFLIHKLARFLFPIKLLENISVRFNCSYIYFSISTLIVILNNPRFKEILSKDNTRVKDFKIKANELIKKGSKLNSIQRSIDYVKNGIVIDKHYDYYKQRNL